MSVSKDRVDKKAIGNALAMMEHNLTELKTGLKQLEDDFRHFQEECQKSTKQFQARFDSIPQRIRAATQNFIEQSFIKHNSGGDDAIKE